MACWCLDLLWNRGNKVGDATNPITGEKIEFKATSRFKGDLSSFGPKRKFDDLVFLRYETDEDELWIYDLHINSEDFANYPANKTQTIGEQQKQKRRPRISLLKLFVKKQKLEPDIIFDIQKIKIIKDNRR